MPKIPQHLPMKMLLNQKAKGKGKDCSSGSKLSPSGTARSSVGGSPQFHKGRTRRVLSKIVLCYVVCCVISSVSVVVLYIFLII